MVTSDSLTLGVFWTNFIKFSLLLLFFSVNGQLILGKFTIYFLPSSIDFCNVLIKIGSVAFPIIFVSFFVRPFFLISLVSDFEVPGFIFFWVLISSRAGGKLMVFAKLLLFPWDDEFWKNLRRNNPRLEDSLKFFSSKRTLRLVRLITRRVSWVLGRLRRILVFGAVH